MSCIGLSFSLPLSPSIYLCIHTCTYIHTYISCLQLLLDNEILKSLTPVLALLQHFKRPPNNGMETVTEIERKNESGFRTQRLIPRQTAAPALLWL